MCRSFAVTALGLGNVHGNITTVDVVDHAAAVGIGLGFVTSVVANSSREGVSHEAFEGRVLVPIADPLVISGCEEGGRGVTNHDVGVVAARGATGDEATVAIHIDHGVGEVVHELRPCERPQNVERPLGTPKGIEVVVGTLALADDGLAARVIGIAAIDIAHDTASEICVPEVGIELGHLGVGAAFHFDAAQPLVPMVV